ncbi:thymidine phosphorylase-like isoform X1 [Salmo trutta]|nr:thymidine phosphorylase-like isoform X1 [Salmo trutta]
MSSRWQKRDQSRPDRKVSFSFIWQIQLASSANRNALLKHTFQHNTRTVLSQAAGMAQHEQSAASFPEHIRKKRNGEQLSAGEIRDFVQGVKDKTIQESQIGAMLMAIWLQGMVAEETLALTKEMMMSGEVMSWPAEWEGLVVDKHSTGGVGDKISLVLAPALAACGCKVPMISGRGLAHTGGTLDKLESIPGFNVYQSVQQLHGILEEVGCCIVGQTDNLVPADKVMYALRDVTSTVDSLPLITGSIISKKGAESLNALVLDVKFGNAALYKDLGSAKSLAQSMVTVGNSLGIRTGAVLSRMNCPIGRCVGNTLEVMESLECLKGRGPDDILELVTSLGGLLLWMVGRAGSLEEGKKVISTTLQNGAALEKFQNMMIGQGVTSQIAASLCSTNTDYYGILRRAHYQTELETQGHGTVLDIDGMVIAQVLHRLGAGRSKAGDPVNHSVGAELLLSLGQKVEKGQPWLRVHYETPALSAEQRLSLQGALTLGPADQLLTQPLVAEIILP